MSNLLISSRAICTAAAALRGASGVHTVYPPAPGDNAAGPATVAGALPTVSGAVAGAAAAADGVDFGLVACRTGKRARAASPHADKVPFQAVRARV